VFSAIVSRETHVSDTAEPSNVQISFIYSDGFGHEIQTKAGAEADSAGRTRWVGTGWTVFNNKGKPVRKYEPFFTNTHNFEFDNKAGVSSILFYDPPGRVVATLNPNHSWSKTVFDPWKQETWDLNDTVELQPQEDEDVRGFFRLLDIGEYLPTWLDQRRTGGAGPDELSVAGKTERHGNTPQVVYLNTLKQKISITEDNGEEKYTTQYVLDITGKVRELRDARNRVVERYDYDFTGREIRKASMDSGERWTLYDILNKKIRSWDSRGQRFHYGYDALGRPTETSVARDAEEKLVEKLVYGGSAIGNRRGRLSEVFDQGGKIEMDYDFKGNVVRTQRVLALDYKNALDWAREVELQTDVFSTVSQIRCFEPRDRANLTRQNRISI
jgi:hypothetical protein